MALSKNEVKSIMVPKFLGLMDSLVNATELPILDAQEYSDTVKYMVYCRDLIGKPQYFASISTDPLQDLAKFWTDYDSLCTILSQQDSGHSYAGMYAPNVVQSEMLSTLKRVAGVNAQAKLDDWALDVATGKTVAHATA